VRTSGRDSRVTTDRQLSESEVTASGTAEVSRFLSCHWQWFKLLNFKLRVSGGSLWVASRTVLDGRRRREDSYKSNLVEENAQSSIRAMGQSTKFAVAGSSSVGSTSVVFPVCLAHLYTWTCDYYCLLCNRTRTRQLCRQAYAVGLVPGAV
jgi:hypothetical protein